MALLTSLYLCSRTVYAAVGTPTGSGARVVAAAQTELPEGCLINGVITNEADLTAALKEFFTANKLPMNHVALIAGGSQFMHRILSLPAMSEKKRMAVLSHELASGGAEVRAPLDDYMLLSRDAKTRVDTVLATRVVQGRVATVAVKEFIFKHPVRVGDLLSFYSSVVRVGRTSVTVDVEVFAESLATQGRYVKVTQALLTYVAIDEHGQPRPIATAGTAPGTSTGATA